MDRSVNIFLAINSRYYSVLLRLVIHCVCQYSFLFGNTVKVRPRIFVADASSVLACMLFAFNISRPTFIFPQKITFYYETLERIMDEFETEGGFAFASGSNL